MDKNKEVTLPSGAILKITISPFNEGKALHLAVLEELVTLKVDANAELGEIYKNLFCLGFSSKKIEKALEACMKRATYNDRHINDDTFEPITAREDYIVVLWEVAQHNLLPFMKNLRFVFSRISETLTFTPKQ